MAQQECIKPISELNVDHVPNIAHLMAIWSYF